MTVYEMQELCRRTLEYLKAVISPGMSLKKVRRICEQYMLDNGADSFWYWDVGAFVFSGKDTVLSVSGKNYQTADSLIQHDDIITIDLSPQNNNIWGDYARTVILENGKVVDNLIEITNEEWRNGIVMEEYLHCSMKNFVTENTTFEELYYHINKIIVEKGYMNLDFLGNLGHSIVMDKKDRVYIEKGNTQKLSSVTAFTFEPHICRVNGTYGVKMENIYSFENGKLTEK
ncbi:MAG: aminopeptidase P family protein [Ruminococcaceae bacterium]|nr:aminopeptidase P family protein [Oscillospiraceae bacterium]